MDFESILDLDFDVNSPFIELQRMIPLQKKTTRIRSNWKPAEEKRLADAILHTQSIRGHSLLSYIPDRSAKQIDSHIYKKGASIANTTLEREIPDYPNVILENGLQAKAGALGQNANWGMIMRKIRDLRLFRSLFNFAAEQSGQDQVFVIAFLAQKYDISVAEVLAVLISH